jgi:Putative restriction endonuclease
VNDPDLEAAGGEGALDRSVIGAGALDGDDEVTKAVRLDGLSQRRHGLLEAAAGVLDLSGRDEDAAVVIGEHPLGPGLGAIDGDDAEVLGPGRLGPGMDRSRGLGDRGGAPVPARGSTGRGGHADTSGSGGRDIPKPAG